jgi:NodT family efflux transporter outer membrane factor (OMF) lipoprotein
VAADQQVQHFALGAKIAEDWWRLFKSPKLDQMIKDAVAENLSLQSAQARLRQSQENLRAGYGVFFPQVSASFNPTRQKFSPAKFGSAATPSIFSLYTLTGTVSYLLDIFGGQRRTVEGLAAQADYQNYTAQATYLTLLGNVVNAAVAQAAYRAEIEATEQIIAFEKEQLRLTETQFKAGTVPYSTVVSIQSQLAATEATLPPLRLNLNKTQHLLAALAGRTPAEWAAPRLELADFTLPLELPVTLPSALARQRPDILAAEATLHSASANIGVATAALFPSVTLSGNLGQNSSDLAKLFAGPANFYSFGATLATPVFQGGSLWFQRKAAMQAYEASLTDYRQVVVSAFQQVADTLRAVEHDAETLQAQAAALAAAGEALQLLKTNYAAGLVNYLQILTADNAYQQARLGYIQAQALRLQDTAALFIALGGGWWNPQTQTGKNDLPRPSKTGMASADRSPQPASDKLPGETSAR